MIIKKYEMTDETIVYEGHTLHRIKALRPFVSSSFGKIERGALGGFIENERNLSHHDGCWIKDNAKVFDDAIVFNDARISGDAVIFENARVYGEALVSGNNIMIYENSEVLNKACIYSDVEIYGNATVSNGTYESGVRIFGSIVLREDVYIRGTHEIYDVSTFCGARSYSTSIFGVIGKIIGLFKS